MRVSDGIMQGLQEAIDYNEGKIKVRTKTISIEPVLDFAASEKIESRCSVENSNVNSWGENLE